MKLKVTSHAIISDPLKTREQQSELGTLLDLTQLPISCRSKQQLIIYHQSFSQLCHAFTQPH